MSEAAQAAALSRRRRRMSGRMSIGSTKSGRLSIGSGLDGNDDNTERRVRRNRRKSFGTPLMASPSAKTAAQSHAQVSAMYQQVLKMSTENKINQKNTWSLNLIDHIENLIEEDSAASTMGPDFQKASCTLDASIKIYSYRVDDVWNSSFRVLENLNRTDSDRQKAAADAAAAANKGASKKLGLTDTLESNVASITVRKFDLEFDVDPLFHKMSKTFDEGGARGMLLNNLSVHDGCDIAFDSVDVADVDAQPESRPESADKSFINSSGLAAALTAACSSANIASLCPPLGSLYAELDSARAAIDRAINGKPKRLPGDTTVLDATMMAGGHDSTYIPSGDFAPVDDDDDDSDDGGAFFDAGMGMDMSGTGSDEAAWAQERRMRQSLGGDAEAAEVGGFESAYADFGGVQMDDAGIGARAAKAGGAAAMLCDAAGMFSASGASGDYAYFDSSRLAKFQSHHWAGPGHAMWKFAKGAKGDKTGAGGGKTGKPKAAKKKKFAVDFSGKAQQNGTEYAPPPRSATATQMSAASIARAVSAGGDAYALPPDVHYDAQELAKLFTRPHTMVSLPRSAAGGAAGASAGGALVMGSGDMVGDAMHDGFDMGGFGGGGDDDDDDDDGDAFGGADMTFFDNAAASSGDLDTTTFMMGMGANVATAAHTVEKIDIRHATVAKKVDVRKLKENLWDFVDTTVAAKADAADDPGGDPENSSEVAPLAPGKPAAPAAATAMGPKEVSFNSAITTLAPKVPSNITVPFYFICTLHLANERGLALQGNSDLSDFTIKVPDEEGGVAMLSE